MATTVKSTQPAEREAGARGPLLCAVDGSPTSDVALRAAARLSRRIGVSLCVVMATPEPPSLSGNGRLGGLALRSQSLARARSAIDEAIKRCEAEANATATIRVGDPATVIGALASQLGAELIVTGSRGRGAVGALVLGSVSQQIVRQATRPVLIVPDRAGHGLAAEREEGAPRGLCVVCGVDPEEGSHRAVRAAARLAGSDGGRVVLAQVRAVSRLASANLVMQEPVFPTFQDSARRESIRHLRRAAGMLDASTDRKLVLAVGHQATCLQRIASDEEADIVAVGSSGRGPVGSAALGSVSTSLVAYASHPVLIAPPGARLGETS